MTIPTARFRYQVGDIFSDDADRIVIPVNCQGVAGAGLAKEWAARDPEGLAVYQRQCREGRLAPGGLVALDGRYILAATKDRWRDPSVGWWVDRALEYLADYTVALRLKSIAIPALGCGLGGLPWGEVEEDLKRRFEKVDADVRVYPPQGGR